MNKRYINENVDLPENLDIEYIKKCSLEWHEKRGNNE